MADPTPSRKTPPRAEPIQPDRPGRGLDRDKPGEQGSGAEPKDAPRRRAEQEDTALDNVREGYD